MLTPFTKMHGLGNDFVVFDNRSGDVKLSPERARAIANRREGVGFDQMLFIEQSRSPECDLAFRIVNADGSEVEHCGNGARCVAAFAHARGLTNANPLRLQLPTRIICARRCNDGRVAVDMGEPEFEPHAIPFVASERQPVYTLDLDTGPVQLGAVSMGNPHALLVRDDVAVCDLRALAVPIQAHRAFPQRVNVGVMSIDSRSSVHLRVYERGVGETQACGTGACAAVAIARLWQLVDAQVTVHLPGGSLDIAWTGPGHALWMTGPTAFVFDGEIEI
jgi:diaminopimelate epimerase